MNEMDVRFLKYLFLPYATDAAPESGSEPSSFTCTTLATIHHKGKAFPHRKIEREGYIFGKLLPAYDEREAKETEFGFGPLKVDPALLLDIPRMTHTIQHKKIARCQTTGPDGMTEVLRSLYRLSDYDPDTLYKISCLYHQIIGNDLFRLSLSSLESEHMTPLLSGHWNSDIFRDDEDILVTGQIKGKVYDTESGSFLPIAFVCSGRYNLTRDRTFQEVKFRLCEGQS